MFYEEGNAHKALRCPVNAHSAPQRCKNNEQKKKFVYDASSTGYLLIDILAVSPLILSSRVFLTKNKEYLHFLLKKELCT